MTTQPEMYTQCPVCNDGEDGSALITVETEMWSEDNFFYVSVQCAECDAEWTDVYQYVKSLVTSRD